MLNFWPFKRKPAEPRGWPWSHREWIDVEIPNVGTVVGWNAEPGVVLCMTKDGTFVDYKLPDYKRETENAK